MDNAMDALNSLPDSLLSGQFLESRFFYTVVAIVIFWLVKKLVMSVMLRDRDVQVQYRIRKTVAYIIYPLAFIVIGRITTNSRMLPWKKLTSLMATRPKRSSSFLSVKRNAGRLDSNILSIPTVKPNSGGTANQSTSMAMEAFTILRPWFCKESSAGLTKGPSTPPFISVAAHALHA